MPSLKRLEHPLAGRLRQQQRPEQALRPPSLHPKMHGGRVKRRLDTVSRMEVNVAVNWPMKLERRHRSTQQFAASSGNSREPRRNSRGVILATAETLQL
jgi:hypothetical protein